MNLNVQNQIEKLMGRRKYDNESYLQYFDRLNLDGSIDLRAVAFTLSIILDYLDEHDYIEYTSLTKPKTKVKPAKK